MFVDTHQHVSDEQFAKDRGEVIRRAAGAGVTLQIEIAESPETWEAAVSLAAKHPFIYASLGIHPHHAHLYGPTEWPALRERLVSLARHPKVVAIGEFGLDYFRMQNTHEQQDFLFRSQLELARELAKPIVIHCREAEAPKLTPAGESPAPTPSAHADIQKRLREFYPMNSATLSCPKPNGVIHCFSGRWADAQIYFQLGFVLGVDGPVTYPNAKLLQQIVTRMPLERLVLETDSPYLPPQELRGQRNEPGNLPMVAAHVATLKHKTVEQIADQTSRNARALFRLPS